MDLTNASAIVTGGGSGLGAATARALARNGARVVVLDRDEVAARAVAEEIAGRAAVADVVDVGDVEAAVTLAVGEAPLRVLVNCAGITRAARVVNHAGEPFDLDAFELVIRVNLVGSFNCLRLAAAAMRRQEPLPSGERGSILNTASAAAFDGQIGQAAYSASKAGIVGMTLPIARDLASYGIRINTIAPGLFDTPIYGSGPEADAWKASLGEHVVYPKRLGDADEFADMAIAVLRNGYMNGAIVRLDGAIRLPPR
jgi:NAD(P)-dependent dehydrogenase (short-subunit alcohol dehydrogenase family)